MSETLVFPFFAYIFLFSFCKPGYQTLIKNSVFGFGYLKVKKITWIIKCQMVSNTGFNFSDFFSFFKLIGMRIDRIKNEHATIVGNERK